MFQIMRSNYAVNKMTRDSEAKFWCDQCIRSSLDHWWWKWCYEIYITWKRFDYAISEPSTGLVFLLRFKILSKKSSFRTQSHNHFNCISFNFSATSNWWYTKTSSCSSNLIILVIFTDFKATWILMHNSISQASKLNCPFNSYNTLLHVPIAFTNCFGVAHVLRLYFIFLRFLCLVYVV